VSKLKIAGIIRESIVDGPGIRFTVFAQGCPHHCEECHNPQTWSFDGGYEADSDQIIKEMKLNPILKGLTLSGGEPFCQSSPMAELSKAAHDAGYDVITYTGYTFENLLEKSEADEGIKLLLEQTDFLIDGLFIRKLKSFDLRFKGSSNQRTIDVKASLKSGNVVIADI